MWVSSSGSSSSRILFVSALPRPGGVRLFHPGGALLRPPHGDRVPGLEETYNRG
uniref:Uncharacterized protein n=1 Tax=Anguilla anguilla TaxID=7936 RepID=A0A0E9VFI7_ANGAN